MTGNTPATGAGDQARRWDRGLLAALAGLSAAGLARDLAVADARHARRDPHRP